MFSANATDLTLSSSGSARYIIAVASDAVAAERTAADELQKYLNQVTGTQFDVRDERDLPSDSPRILVGAGESARRLLPQMDWDAIGKDGIVIQSQNGSLILAGGRPRGTLYAVYQFLEDAVGCRWWTPTESTIPHVPELIVPAQSVRFVPPFSYREHLTTGTRYDPEFATKLRENGSHQDQTLEWGGHYDILGFVHTLSVLLPPEKYFREHPEWYTDPARNNLPCGPDSPMPDGQATQLCLSNPAVLKELTKNALQWISEHPDAGYISISQNDNFASCACENCRAIAEREGSESGPVLEFVNAVADEIARVYPKFWVETLAYTYSEKPPRTVRPASNVVIRLALALADYGHPINSEWNLEARDKVLSWAEIAPHLFIWSYATNFKKAMFPHPNWMGLADDLRFFAAHNVQGVFVQGDCYTGDVGDFPRLRAWLMGKLLWNPELDPRALTKEFLDGYYGSAGTYLQQYLDLMTSAFEAQKRGLNTNNRDFSFLTLDVVNKAIALFHQARAAAGGDQAILDRVRREELSLTVARIARERSLLAESKASGIPYSTEGTDVREFSETAKTFGLRLWGENVSLDEGLAELSRTAAPRLVELPRFARKFPRSDVIDFQPEMLTLAYPGKLTDIRADSEASGGTAAVMKTDSHAWLVQAQLGPYLDVAGEKWRVYAVVRAAGDVNPDSGRTAFEGGVFDDSGMKHEGRFTVDFGKLSQSKYSVVDLGAHRLTPGMMIWFAPHSPEPVNEFLFDRVLLVREKAASARP